MYDRKEGQKFLHRCKAQSVEQDPKLATQVLFKWGQRGTYQSSCTSCPNLHYECLQDSFIIVRGHSKSGGYILVADV